MTSEDLKKKDIKVSLQISLHHITRELPTSVIDVDDGLVFLEPAYENGKSIGFPADCEISLLVIYENNLYAWKQETLPFVKRDRTECYLARCFGEAEHYNRRESYRIFVGETMEVGVYKEGQHKLLNVLVHDLSEGGMCFVDTGALDVSRTVRINIAISEEEKLSVGGLIIRKDYNEERKIYTYGCHFSDRNRRLGEYIMLKQRDKQAQKNGRSRKNGNDEEYIPEFVPDKQ